MASGGMDWFRWHHGSVTDPKFQLVARKVGCSLAEVIAVWACILEAASQAEERGTHGALDFEALDCALGLPDGRAQDIYLRMQDRALVDGETVTAWHKRQPKREREDDNSTGRVREFRKRNRTKTPGANTLPLTPAANGVADDVTPCNAMKRHETPRGEERRGDISPPTPTCVVAEVDGEGEAAAPPADQNPKSSPKPPPDPSADTGRTPRYAAAAKAMRMAGVSDAHPGHAQLQAFVRSGVPPDVFASAGAEAVARGKGFAYALKIVRSQLDAALEIDGSVASFQTPAASPIPAGWI